MASDEFIRLLMKLNITEENLTTRPKRKNKKEKKKCDINVQENIVKVYPNDKIGMNNYFEPIRME